jgi:hypothetical protein
VLILAKREEGPQPHEAFKFSHRRRPASQQELSQRLRLDQSRLGSDGR